MERVSNRKWTSVQYETDGVIRNKLAGHRAAALSAKIFEGNKKTEANIPVCVCR